MEHPLRNVEDATRDTSSPARSCTGCAYLVADAGGDYCWHPSVDGENRLNHREERPFCSTARKDFGKLTSCGPAARYWTAPSRPVSVDRAAEDQRKRYAAERDFGERMQRWTKRIAIVAALTAVFLAGWFARGM